MAAPSMRRYVWTAADQVWTVAGRYMTDAGYESTSVFVDAIRAANPTILDWCPGKIAAGTIVVLPYVSG